MYKFTRIAKDERFKRLPCLHKGTYADDCLVDRIKQVSAKLNITAFVYDELLQLKLLLASRRY